MAVSNVTTVLNPFFESGESSMFSVMEGIPAINALERASCFLLSAKEPLYDVSETAEAAHASIYLIEMAKALIDSVAMALIRNEPIDPDVLKVAEFVRTNGAVAQ